jgi:hypothetical protein
MKFTYAMWLAILVVGFFTAGFFPALLLTALAMGGSVSTGLHVQELGGRGGWAKELGR